MDLGTTRSKSRLTRRSSMLLVALAVFVTVLIPGNSAEANEHYYYYSNPSGPCPNWSIDDVLADLDGDWDGDRVDNGDEVFVSNGLNPCVYDSADFCVTNPTYCYDVLWSDVEYYLVYNVTSARTCVGGYWSWASVNANPHGDWDHDDVSNLREANNGANPCVAPCPTAYHIDVALNPWGDWDYDGRSNQLEVTQRTNPCVYNAPIRVQYVQVPVVTYTYVPQTTTQRLPHVGSPATTTTYVAPAPTVNPCPAAYPYFHEANGQCYANPIKPWG